MLSDKLCPYPGLRPFSEEESIFFKGREEHIEKIISQLEEKKFVMLTGASGDGKSSLVYAGVIPNAKAGFFKAKFNNWLIADFRPERNPLKNLATVIAEKLGYFDVEHVEKELGSGFSSLVKLYKNSPLYLDQNSEVWKNADEKGQKLLKRKAANLFILVDQFEEFFTNIENFNDGKTSLQSQAVVNLLLETARIALVENLPIYIICTMRSDYIGQCASFRGLPEFIGFSQFFVPRLKRKELVQVIEEPALLSGTKINKRLTEVLINELNEGIDQLPILQHALNRTWKMAMEEDVEMDLIHFTKLGGMESTRLPKEDKEKYSAWFKSLPAFKKEYFKSPSLSNVLDAHANELFETANEKCGIDISKEDAKQIISTSFKCLTKIDENRAVRNRMTLEEITRVINHKNISSDKVNAVLNLFREQGNTFVRPFIDEDPESRSLQNEDVLDITHESFIRNWNLLIKWSKEEQDNLTNFYDFSKQMERWIASKRKKAYLLPKGALAFFEKWYASAKINSSWLLKYDQREVDANVKNTDAQEKINNVNKFLGRSRRRFTILKWIQRASLAWALFWVCFMWYKATNSAQEEKSKADKLKTVMKFDQLNAKVIAPSSYVMTGNEYTSDIFIAASSSNLGGINAKILIGTVDTLGNITNVTDTVPVVNGTGTFRKIANEPGLHAYQGVIQIKSPDGNVQNYPFAQDYMVAAPSLDISLAKMNILYFGVNNPLSVSVAGVVPSDLSVTSSCGKITKGDAGGKYLISFKSKEESFAHKGQVTIKVGITTKEGKVRSVGEMQFRVKWVPSPNASFAGIVSDGMVDIDELKNARGVIPKLEDFMFDLKFPVISWRLTMFANGRYINADAQSAAITSEQKKMLENVKKGQRILIEDVWIMAPEGKRKISGCTLEVK